MASQTTIYIIASDRHRNGKTLLARVLVDSLLLQDRDPFVIDAGFPEGTLRAAFPGRTALVDFAQVQGQMKLFDTILASPGRDYVIDLPAPQCDNFFATARKLGFFEEAARCGFQVIILFIVDKDRASLTTAYDLRDANRPAELVAVRNSFVGSALIHDPALVTIDLPTLDRDALNLLEDKRFSIRAFMLGEATGIPLALRPLIRNFCQSVIDSLRDIQSALTLLKLRR